MRALVRHDDGVRLTDVAAPVAAAGQVVIEVVVAGLCRTDLQVASGALPCAPPRILGHELAGVIAGEGGGQRVTVMPLVPCGDCPGCVADQRCRSPRMVGVDVDGGFAEYVSLPAGCVYPVPDQLPFRLAAYAEPVCAALGVLRAGLDPAGRGLILGGGRIATLIERVLAVSGFARLERRSPGDALDDGGYDFAVEADPAALDRAIAALIPGGTLVLKSRPAAPVPLDLRAAVLRDVTLRAVGYGDMRQAIALLASGALALDDLLGPVRPLEEFEQVFAEAGRSEARKLFLALSGEALD